MAYYTLVGAAGEKTENGTGIEIEIRMQIRNWMIYEVDWIGLEWSEMKE